MPIQLENPAVLTGDAETDVTDSGYSLHLRGLQQELEHLTRARTIIGACGAVCEKDYAKLQDAHEMLGEVIGRLQKRIDRGDTGDVAVYPK